MSLRHWLIRTTTAFLVAALALPVPAAAEGERERENPSSAAGGVLGEDFAYPFVPVLTYSRETSALFGIMMVRAHRWKGESAETRPNTIALSGFYTLRDQGGIGFAPSVYLDGERYLFKPVLYLHRSPATFWGVGNEAGEREKGEDFTASGGGLLFTATARVFKSLRLGPCLRFTKASLSDLEEGGFLEGDGVQGSDGGTIGGAGLVLEWDSRDSIYWPTRGGYHQATAEWFGRYLGSDFDYAKYTLDFRVFFPLAENHILGIHGTAEYMRGDPPFFALAWLGGIEVMRGLYEGRFRDKTMAALQAEYRVNIWRRIGAALFGGLGEVAEDPSDFTFGNLRFAGGAGLRIALDPKDRINLRLDLGFSEFGTAPILVITEAF